MIELVVFAWFIQSSSSCMCWSPADPALFCDNPTWNAVQIRVKEITIDIPTRWSIYEDLVNGVELQKRDTGNAVASPTPTFGTLPLPTGTLPLPTYLPLSFGPWTLSPPRSPIWDEVEEIWLNSEKEVVAVVDKVWGLGGAKVGEEMRISSSNYESMCGVADQLVVGMTAVLWVKQDTDKINLSSCALDRFKWLGDSGPEKYVESLNSKNCP